MTADHEDPRLIAAIDLMRRTGQHSFQLRYSDDEQPVVWMAIGEWKLSKEGRPVPEGQHAGTYFECAAAMTPLQAVLRLCDRMVDGGECGHCHRPSAVSDDFSRAMPLDRLFCWYVYDPEMKIYRRGCEGDT